MKPHLPLLLELLRLLLDEFDEPDEEEDDEDEDDDDDLEEDDEEDLLRLRFRFVFSRPEWTDDIKIHFWQCHMIIIKK